MEKNEIPVEDLQQAIFDGYDGHYYILSRWIDAIKKIYPDANIQNHYGSKSGYINGVYYEFIEGFYWMRNAPKIYKTKPQRNSLL